MHTVADKLNALRAQLDQHSLDAWIAPTADPHLSEYLPEHWQSRVWLSGFTGSAGTLAITKTAAALWADSRYWEQAAVQLAGSEIELGKLGTGGNHVQWLLQHLHGTSRCIMRTISSPKYGKAALPCRKNPCSSTKRRSPPKARRTN